MANIYNVDYSDLSVDPANKQPLVIPPGAWDTSTSLSLPGYSAALYGEHIAENFIHLMENFASETQPANPTVGQLWYVPSIRALKVLIKITTAGDVKTYTWRTVGAISTTITPPDDTSGLWYDTSNVDPLQWQLKIYNTGTGVWTSVADRYVKKSGDVITGSILVASPNVGLTTGQPQLAGFYPGVPSGVTIASPGNVVVLINGVPAGGSSFGVTKGAAFADSNAAGKLLFSVGDTGTVTITQGVLNMSNYKVTTMAPGVAGTDAVNLNQLTAVSNSLGSLITDLDNRKVNRSGDVMTGGLQINANGNDFIGNGTPAGLVINNAKGGVLTCSSDSTGVQNAINVTNNFGLSGSNQSMFNVKSFTGNTTIAGTLVVGKATTLSGTLTVAGATQLSTISSMEAPITAITYARHLTTKEYVDTKIEASKPTDVYARVNPASPRGGDILVSGAATYIYNNGWNLVFPAQWAP